MLLHLCVSFLATMFSGIWNIQGTTDYEQAGETGRVLDYITLQNNKNVKTIFFIIKNTDFILAFRDDSSC